MPVSAVESIRPSRREDIPQLSALFRDAFGQERDASIWEWKYFSNPHGSYGFVCDVDGRIVAHCGGTPIEVTDRGRSYTALQSVDFSSTRQHAGGLGAGGVFARTVKGFFARYCGAERVPLVYGFPGERHRLFGERILGYHAIEPVGELRLEPESERGELFPFDDSKLALLSHVPVPVGGLRSNQWLRWRYLNHPAFRYSTVTVKRWWKGAEAIAVLRDAGEAFMLMELEGSYDSGVMQRMVRQLRNLGKPVIAWGSLSHSRSAAMIAAGFKPAERDHRFECRIFSNRPLFRAGEFYYSLGDYDVY